MSARKSGKPRIALVGAGNLTSALAVSLRAAGYNIEQIISRDNAASLQRARRLAREVGASAVGVSQANIEAGIIWFCITDSAIAGAAASLAQAANWRGKVAFHSSGALTSDELALLRQRGAAVASIHPLMTFVRGSRPQLAGVAFALEGDPKAVRAARAIVQNLRGKPFSIRKPQKQLYHSWGMFASPLLAALLAASENVAAAAGIDRKEARQRIVPILRQTLDNYARLGAAQSFSGPIARGDVATIQKHLEVLRQVTGAREVYVALAAMALRDLPARNRAALRNILEG